MADLATRLKKEARNAYRSKQFEEAAAAYALLFEQVGEAGEPDAVAVDRVDQGVSLVRCGKPEAAAAAFERAVVLQPDYVRARLRYGQTLSRLERHAEAVEQLEAAVRLAPDSADALAMLGGELRWLGRTADAREALERALAIDPTHVDAKLTLLALGREGANTVGVDLEEDAPTGLAVPSRVLDGPAPPPRRERKPVHPALLFVQALGLVVVGLWVRSLFP